MPKKTTSIDDQSVTIKFEDDSSASLSLTDLTPEITMQLALHGLSQKLGDSYAGPEKRALAPEVVAGVIQGLKDGNWTVRGEGGTRVTQLARALVLYMKEQGQEITEQDAAEKLHGMEDENKKAITAALNVQLTQIKATDAAAAAKRATEKAADAPALDVGALLG